MRTNVKIPTKYFSRCGERGFHSSLALENTHAGERIDEGLSSVC